MSDEHLVIDRDDRGVITLTLNRPDVRNAFSEPMMRGMVETFEALHDDEDVRAIVLTGSGSAFSAGADLNWMSSQIEGSFEDHVEDSRGFERMLRAVHDTPAPVLARVNGHALGGASGLLSCCDISVAVTGARFGFTEAKLGLVPAMISAYVIPRIGVTNARRYLLTGEVFDTATARDIGLVNEMCEPEDLDATFEGVLGEVLSAGPKAQRETKPLIRRVAASTDPAETEQLRVELISRIRTTEEAQQRMRAFLARRG